MMVFINRAQRKVYLSNINDQAGRQFSHVVATWLRVANESEVVWGTGWASAYGDVGCVRCQYPM